MDAEKPHPLLEQLLPLLYESDFDTLFANLTQGESNNTRFLLKMELKRLAAPCVRSIDLRARHNAVSFVHSGIQHFMTPEEHAHEKQLAHEKVDASGKSLVSQEEMDRIGSGGSPLLVAFCWAAVVIPLAFGICKTLEKALVLFS